MVIINPSSYHHITYLASENLLLWLLACFEIVCVKSILISTPIMNTARLSIFEKVYKFYSSYLYHPSVALSDLKSRGFPLIHGRSVSCNQSNGGPYYQFEAPYELGFRDSCFGLWRKWPADFINRTCRLTVCK